MTIPCVSRKPCRRAINSSRQTTVTTIVSCQLLAPLFEVDVISSKRVSQSNLFVINFVNSSIILSPMDLRVEHV